MVHYANSFGYSLISDIKLFGMYRVEDQFIREQDGTVSGFVIGFLFLIFLIDGSDI